MKADAVILNPHANAGNGAERWRRLLESDTARDAGLAEAALFDGSQPGGIEAIGDWISAQLRAGARRFVAAGGDGTLNLVLNTLLNSPERAALPPGSIQLGAVGLGSSNDFQKPYDLPGRVLAHGLRCRLDFAQASAHDVGEVELELADGATTRRRFLLNASVGVTAEANWTFNEAKTGTLGFLKRNWVDGAIVATALSTFRGYRNFAATIQVGDTPARPVTLTNLGVVKNVHFSGQMRYDVPQARDDGSFGVHVCEDMGRLEMIGTLSALSAGKFSGRTKTSSLQARQVSISADQAFAVETDGEVTRARAATFKLLPKEIDVCP